jgi:hypothetical protein
MIHQANIFEHSKNRMSEADTASLNENGKKMLHFFLGHVFCLSICPGADGFELQAVCWHGLRLDLRTWNLFEVHLLCSIVSPLNKIWCPVQPSHSRRKVMCLSNLDLHLGLASEKERPGSRLELRNRTAFTLYRTWTSWPDERGTRRINLTLLFVQTHDSIKLGTIPI